MFRDALIRFRLGISELSTHCQRYITGAEKMICPLCREDFETEIHFMFICPALYDLREKYVCRFLDVRSVNQVEGVLASNQKHIIRAVSMYLYKAFMRRREAIDSCERNVFYTE